VDDVEVEVEEMLDGVGIGGMMRGELLECICKRAEMMGGVCCFGFGELGKKRENGERVLGGGLWRKVWE
jgi:hypothetical protein